MTTEQIIQENARRNAEKKKDYDPVSGLNCCGDRFVLQVADKNPRTFYMPVEMADHKAILLLKKHGSIAGALREQLKRKPTQTQIDYFWLKVCEERYKYDFEFFAITCITIIDKMTADPIKFRLNQAQRMLLFEFEEQNIKLKTELEIQKTTGVAWWEWFLSGAAAALVVGLLIFWKGAAAWDFIKKIKITKPA